MLEFSLYQLIPEAHEHQSAIFPYGLEDLLLLHKWQFLMDPVVHRMKNFEFLKLIELDFNSPTSQKTLISQ